MNIVNFPESNKTYVAPDCLDLPVYEQGNLKISCWEMTPQELLYVLFVRKVWLQLTFPVQPPIALMAENPFKVGNMSHSIEEVVSMLVFRRIQQFLEKRDTDGVELADLLNDFALFLVTSHTAE